MSKNSKLGDWFGKLLYAMLVSAHHEDYICEDASGNITRTPANVWHAKVMEDLRQR